MNEAPDAVEKRLRAVLGRRHFVDRETGVLLVWLPADASSELSELVGELESRHPAGNLSASRRPAPRSRCGCPPRTRSWLATEALYVAD